jgi:ribonuclease BN (tRNA processing enzyme)
MSSTIKLTVLGSGTCVPDGQRNSSGYFLETAEARIMLDCGAGTLHALARFGLAWERMTHLFLSHFHVDHIGELASLMFAFRYAMTSERTDPLELIGPVGLDRVLRGLSEAFGEKLFNPPFPLNVRQVDPGDVIPIGTDSTVAVCSSPHTNESICARIESKGSIFCYTGDTDYDERLASFFSRADLLVSECSFVARRPGVRHLAIADAARIAALAGVKRLLLSHFYFDIAQHDIHAEIRNLYSGELFCAHDGFTIEF